MSVFRTVGFIAMPLICASAAAFAAGADMPDDEVEPVFEAPIPIEFYSGFDPATSRITARLATIDGKALNIVVDRATDAAYLADSTGATAVISIPSLADAYAVGDPSKRASFIDAMHRALDAGTAVEIIAKQPGIAFAPPNGLASPCDMQPCGVLQRQFLDGQLESIIRWSVEGIDYSYQNFFTPEQIAEDLDDFKRWQAQQCGAVNSENIEALWGLVGSIGSCPTAGSVLGFAICTSTVATALQNHNQSLTAERGCRMQYPGPGGW